MRKRHSFTVGDLVRLKGPPIGWKDGTNGFWVGDLAVVKSIDPYGTIAITSWKQIHDYCPYIELRNVEKVDVQEG